MNQLPEYFCIKRDADNPLWDKYIQWLRLKGNRAISGDGYGGLKYYGNHESDIWRDSPSTHTEITLEQWDAIVNPFVLPEKWCILRTTENFTEVNAWFNEHTQTGGKFTENGALSCSSCQFLHYPAFFGHYPRRHADDNLVDGYTLITDQQFKTHVLTEKYISPKENIMDKKIIGYNWKKGFKLDYDQAAAKIVGYASKGIGDESIWYQFQTNSGMYNSFKEAGVLDLWFEPVYEESKKELIIIKTNGQTIKLEISRKNITCKCGESWADRYTFTGNDIIEKLRQIPKKVGNVGSYDVCINTVDIGCQKGIKLEDIQKAIKIWDGLQDK